jgi:hypothetical protein
MKVKGTLLVVLAMALISLAMACGGTSTPAPTATPPASSDEEATPAAAEATPTSAPASDVGASGDFHGIPLPGGATQAQNIAWTLPAGEEGDYAKMEWQAYKTALETDQLTSFYKSEMTKKGWTQTMWFEGMGDEGGMAWGLYSRDNESESAWIYVFADEEDFNLVLVWAGGE